MCSRRLAAERFKLTRPIRTNRAHPRTSAKIFRGRETPPVETELGPTSVKAFRSIQIASEIKLELINGHIVAFADGTAAHARIAARVIETLRRQRDLRCRVFGSNMALERTEVALAAYPDATYTCEVLEPDAEAIVEPSLIVEVISPGSVERDRVTKLRIYQAIASVREYLIIDSRRIWAAVQRRTADGWAERKYAAGDTLELASIGATIVLSDLYREHGAIGPPT